MYKIAEVKALSQTISRQTLLHVGLGHLCYLLTSIPCDQNPAKFENISKNIALGAIDITRTRKKKKNNLEELFLSQFGGAHPFHSNHIQVRI